MPTDTKQPTDNKQIAHRFMDECWNQGKMDSVRELVSDDCRIHDPAFPTLTSGAENLMRHIGMCRTGFPDLTFSIDDTIAERDEVVLHWTAQGTHKAPFLGMQPTNRNATVSGTSIFRIENSRIVEQWADWNLMSLMEQLGVATIPKEAAGART
ncbi:ester cyclase [Edaphobacter aggregans]|uniref:ester cyclase n=1 Tax=Edaphobacter aggregans TaxID=570835 RepID=UPI00054D2094|nr:ester cyclase [Edaphobacter aggregans]